MISEVAYEKIGFCVRSLLKFELVSFTDSFQNLLTFEITRNKVVVWRGEYSTKDFVYAKDAAFVNKEVFEKGVELVDAAVDEYDWGTYYDDFGDPLITLFRQNLVSVDFIRKQLGIDLDQRKDN